MKRIIELVKEYDELMWGEGGIEDSLLGEEMEYQQEKEERTEKIWNELKLIYQEFKPWEIPNNGLSRHQLDIITNIKKAMN